MPETLDGKTTDAVFGSTFNPRVSRRKLCKPSINSIDIIGNK
jgi:hypothetical protein